MKHPIFAANWKMNHAPADADAFMRQFLAYYPRTQDRTVIFFPPALTLLAVSQALRERTDIKVGVQNMWGTRQYSYDTNQAQAWTFSKGIPTTITQYARPLIDLEKLKSALGLYAQDRWTLGHLTLNYGVRYDVELTQEINPVGIKDPLTGITLSPADITAAQDVLNVQQGVPVDSNNIAHVT